MAEKTDSMATLGQTRLAPVTARDGVDTRKKVKKVTFAKETLETICRSDVINGLGQSAVKLDYYIDRALDGPVARDIAPPSPEPIEGIDDIVDRMLAESDMREFEEFWCEYARAQTYTLKIKVPKGQEVYTCGCGCEATRRRRWCEPCFYDFWYNRICGCDDDECSGECEMLRCGCYDVCSCW